MNVYALKGFKVKVTKDSINAGNDDYSELAKKFLEENTVYSVKETRVNSSHTILCPLKTLIYKLKKMIKNTLTGLHGILMKAMKNIYEIINIKCRIFFYK